MCDKMSEWPGSISFNTSKTQNVKDQLILGIRNEFNYMINIRDFH